MKLLLESIARKKGFKDIFSAMPQKRGEGQVVFPHVPSCGVGFIAALVAKQIAPRRLWIVCANLREQEVIASEFPVWGGDSIFLAEEEQALNAEAISDPELAAERLNALGEIARGGGNSQVIVLTQLALTQKVPPAEGLSGEYLFFQKGKNCSENDLELTLENSGFERVPMVVGRGQWAKRGGIWDIFGLQSEQPLRIELFDDKIESLRWFDVDSQISTQRVEEAKLILSVPEADRPLHEWISASDLVLTTPEATWPGDVVMMNDLPDDWEMLHGDKEAQISAKTLAFTSILESPLGEFDAGDFVLQEARQKSVFQQIQAWLENKWKVAICFANPGEKSRFLELCEMYGGAQFFDSLKIVFGELSRGFTLPFQKVAILASSELFGRYRTASARRRANRQDKARQQRAQAELREFEEGDLVVHATAGIGRYLGIEQNAQGEEMLAIEYKNDSKLLVPFSHAHLVAKYVGLGANAPELNKLGDGRWLKTRKAAEAGILDYAAELLRIQATRSLANGHAHAPDSRWMWEFENSFHFRETPDQLRAIQQTKADMEMPHAMDRLICGDVGFGKTEVAIRAAFKAVTGGSQVAMLVPTTVLAEQHWRNFRERMSDYPIRIELLNRFRAPSEVARTLKGLADGSVDIVIGTHRLVSKDVSFRNLGLVIIDEEQRFGVKHKEEFKNRFQAVDILTLSATPIPRTLYLALMGARDMSTIETPPPNRVPVQTFVAAYNDELIAHAIRREMQRGGQVYFLHNRVQSIENVEAHLKKLVPEARVVVGHGQMAKNELEKVMNAFIGGKADVLLATTIIESGIDIPNANTILIDRADMFGLADLYQLRGRVGRAGHQAWAYLLLPPFLMTTGDARRRIDAIKEYSALGSGFRIAMRDLEIRGAGNLLGTKQSGHIAAIGFDLYCQLLRQSIEAMQQKRPIEIFETSLRLDFLILSEAKWLEFLANYPDPMKRDARIAPCFLPSDWMEDASLRIAAYKALADSSLIEHIDNLENGWCDRFGQIPLAAELLLMYHRIRIAAKRHHISRVEILGKRVMLTRNGGLIEFQNGKVPELLSASARAKLQETFDLLKKNF